MIMKNTRLLAALLVLFSLKLTYGQQAKEEITKKIDELIWASDFQAAINLVDQNLARQSDPFTIAVLQNKKADALIRLGRYQEAEQLLVSLESKLTGQPSEALPLAITKSNLGFLRLNMGRTDLAEEELRKSMGYFEKSGKPECLEAAQALSNLGLVYTNTGKYTQAEQELLMCLSLRQKQLKDSHELIAATYNDLGLVYSQSDKDKALDYYEKASSIYKKLHGDEHLKIAFASINSGIIYRDLELYGDAVNNFDVALKIFEKVYTQPHPTRAITLYNLGQTYLKMGNQKDAMAYYKRALEMYEASYGKKHPEVANVLNAIGNLQLADGEYEDALRYYQQALQANVATFNSSDITTNPPLENFYNGTRLLQTLLFKALALEARYFGHSLKFSDLKDALVILQKCDTLIDLLRQQISNESDKIQLGIVANEVYADGVRIAFIAGQNAFKKRSYYEQAFYFAEKSKSAVLLEAISESEAKSFAGIPENLLNQEKELKSALAICARKLAQGPTPEEEKNLRAKTFTLQHDYEDFIKKLENDFPDYYNLKFNQTSPSIAQLQAVLDGQTMILSYFVDESNNRLYTFGIGRKKFSIEDKALPENFDKEITGFRNSLYYNAPEVYKKTGHYLHSLLIPSRIPGTVKRLVILPTGRLGIIPFEALLTKEAGNSDYKTLPYLVKKYHVQYEFSAGLMLDKAKEKRAQEQPSIFLCAPVSFPEKDNLNDLPGTAAEVNQISGLFGAKQYSSKLFTGRDANETLIKSGTLKQYNYLHLATHGVVDENNPELSRIFLQASSEAEDGNLFAGEIYNLQLNANLVTLSACQTGLGKISKGEGVIGLSRALVYAGARNIIVSFWSVADESTAVLMKDFYAELLDKPSATLSEDLRNAKLKLISKDTYASPYYWAPFVLIGF